MNPRVVGLFIALAVGVASWVLTCAAWRFDRVAAGFLPLEPRAFERFTLVTLGTAGPAPDPNRRGTAIAAGSGEDVLIVDAGRGVAEGLRAAKIPVSQPGTVLLSSLLPENTVGLDDLLAAAWLAGRRTPILLIGPAGTAQVAQDAADAVGPGAVARAKALGEDATAPRFEVLEIEDGWTGTIGAMNARAGGLTGGPLPAFAWRLDAGGPAAVVGGTGWDGKSLETLARGAALLFHDANPVPTPEEARNAGLDVDPDRLRREAALFTGFEEVGAIARRAGVHTLVLIRMRQPPVYDIQVTSRVDDTFDGRIAVAADGDEFVPR